MADDHDARCSPRGMRGLQIFKSTLESLPVGYRFIWIIRNPVDFLHSKRPGGTSLSMSGAGNACYADYLERFVEVFGREKFLFLRSEDLFEHTQAVMDRVHEWVGASPYKYPVSVSEANVNQHVDRAKVLEAQVSLQEQKRFLEAPETVACRARSENVTGLLFDWRAHSGHR